MTLKYTLQKGGTSYPRPSLVVSRSVKGISNRSRLKIAFGWNYLEWGGAQMHFLGIARRLKATADLALWMPEGSAPEFRAMCEDEGIECRFFRRSVSATNPSGLFRKLCRHFRKAQAEAEMCSTLSREGYDVVHVELGPWQSVLALLTLSRHSNVFYTIHNRLPEVGLIRGFIWRLKFSLVGRFRRVHAFAANQDAKDSIGRFASSDFVSRITVTYANINPEELRTVSVSETERSERRMILGVEERDHCVITVGQFIERKGRRVLLLAAKAALRSFPNLRFRWITNSKLAGEELALVDEAGLGDHFKLITMEAAGLDRRGLLSTVASADSFVLPSLVEGLPIAMLEAMALGVPTIATDINGIPEAVTDGVNGVLIPPGDSAALASAILHLVEDDNLRQALSHEAKKIIDSEFTEVPVAHLALSRYQEACDTQA